MIIWMMIMNILLIISEIKINYFWLQLLAYIVLKII